MAGTKIDATDLAALERSHARTIAVAEKARIPWQRWLPAAFSELDKADVSRQHGLLSKAQRTLAIAGWSAPAQSDIEIFR